QRRSADNPWNETHSSEIAGNCCSFYARGRRFDAHFVANTIAAYPAIALRDQPQGHRRPTLHPIKIIQGFFANLGRAAAALETIAHDVKWVGGRSTHAIEKIREDTQEFGRRVTHAAEDMRTSFDVYGERHTKTLISLRDEISDLKRIVLALI